MTHNRPGPHDPLLIHDAAHRKSLAADALRQFAFFRPGLNPEGGFHTLDMDGRPLPDSLQELHTTTRMVHSFCLGKCAGVPGCEAIIDHGMRFLRSSHCDTDHGGFVWGVDGGSVVDGRKLAYGHVFVLLAASSARMVGHPDADAMINDVTELLDKHFWEDGPGLFADEWNRDWTPFSTYRGMNANMHGVEALLAAHDATGRDIYLARAGRILDFFMHQIAPRHDWRIPEHYDQDWRMDPTYAGDPMFRPAGTTPGHSFELARLLLQYWDQSGRPDSDAPAIARAVTDRALRDAWRPDGGLVYTVQHDGAPAIGDRYWWPVTEAIGVLASLLKLDENPQDDVWYRKLWAFAESHFVDHTRGGWYPELGPDGKPCGRQFKGKPDIYHALQADLFPLAPGLSGQARDLPDLGRMV